MEKVSLADIRSWFNQTFDLLERAGCTEFELEPDHYWEIYFSEAFQFEGSEPTPVVGSLGEDIEEVMQDLANAQTEEGAAAWHLLHHLGSLMPLMASQTQVIVLSKE